MSQCSAFINTPLGRVQCTKNGNGMHWRHHRWIALQDDGWIKVEWGKKP